MVTRNHYDSDVDYTFLKTVPKMNHVTNEQITTRGNLNLYAEAYKNRLIIPSAFHPIDAAAGRVYPVRAEFELSIDCSPDLCGAISEFDGVNLDGSIKEDLLQFEEELRHT